VRALEKQIRETDEAMALLQQRIGRMRDPAQAETRARLEANLAELQNERESLVGQIPSNWQEDYKTFSDLVKAEDQARLAYRRAADDAYEEAVSILSTLQASDAFAALESDLRALREVVTSMAPAEAEGRVNDLAQRFGDVAGADDVEAALTDARRALRARQPDPEQALEAYEEAVQAFQDQSAWRAAAVDQLQPELLAYVDAITETLGARQQSRLSRGQALYIASCSASHRDLSLNF
jgi:tetratricopeptide (TPR) repeat protein